MRRLSIVFLVTVFFVWFSPHHNVIYAESSSYYPLIVQLESHVANYWDNFDLTDQSVSVIHKDKHIYRLIAPNETIGKQWLNTLKNDSKIKYVSIDEQISVNTKIQATELQSIQQHYLDFIQLDPAQTIEQGSSNVVVAVLDTGVHPLMQEYNPRLLTGYNAIDDSHILDDPNGHGTMVTSIIAANLTRDGFKSLTDEVKILPIQVAEDDGFIYKSSILKGLQYAIDQQVQVINMSYSGTSFNPLEDELLTEAREAGITLVAASGNDGTNTIGYPAQYDATIAVGSIDIPQVFSMEHLLNNQLPLARSYFSNYGEELTVTAPGSNIAAYATYEQLALASGTSFAAPFVSSLAALLESQSPVFTPLEIERLITEGATYYQDRWTDERGYGAVNFNRTLSLDPIDTSTDLPDKQSESKLLTTTLTDAFQLPDDMDWIKLSVDASTNDIRLIFHDTSDYTIPELSIYDAAGNVVYDRLPAGTYSLDLEKGDYNLLIQEKWGRWTDDTYTVSIQTETFRDVPIDSSHYEGIQALSQRGILSGYSLEDQTAIFKVNDAISRGQVAAIFQRLLALPIPSNKEEILSLYTDITDHYYYRDAVAANYNENIMTGVKLADGTWQFNTQAMTREQMASVLVKALKLNQIEADPVKIKRDNVSLTHQQNVQILANLGLTNQLLDFRPKDLVTRGQFASFLYRALAYEEGSDNT